ncbi:MAG: hypothetical protein K0A90_00180 [Methanosarcinaceae archaeon]|nr:hypothetical protein [Methanosarcinaceae archaeon]
MTNVYTTGEISENIEGDLDNINGEVVKVVVFSGVALPNVKITITSMDGEVLCDDYLTGVVTRFYPKNIVSVSQEQTHIDNYYVMGSLFIVVSGMGDGEKIQDIAIYFK